MPRFALGASGSRGRGAWAATTTMSQWWGWGKGLAPGHHTPSPVGQLPEHEGIWGTAQGAKRKYKKPALTKSGRFKLACFVPIISPISMWVTSIQAPEASFSFLRWAPHTTLVIQRGIKTGVIYIYIIFMALLLLEGCKVALRGTTIQWLLRIFTSRDYNAEPKWLRACKWGHLRKASLW